MHKNLIGRGVAVTALALAVGGMAGATEERSALLDAVPCPGYGVLLVHADAFGGVEPTNLANALLADPDVELVDFFNAVEGTPTLAQLEAYDVVFTFSNYSDGYQDPVALGDNLADYLDGGGIVVASFYSLSSVDALAIQGRWLTGGYSPHQPTSSTLAGAVTLGPAAVHPFHPLLSGVRALDAGFRLDAPVALGARRVAVYSDGSSALAVKRRAIGMPVYLGNLENPGTGDYARVIVNAARWLSPRPCRARDDALPGGEVGGE